MDPRLLITSIGYSLSLIFTLGIAIFVIAKGKDRKLSVLFLLMSIAIAVYEGSHLIGINVADGHLSRAIFMCNLANIFIGIFVAHWVLTLIGNVRERIIPLIIIYATGLGLFTFFCFFPETFLIDSVPKLYLPNYYEPGKFYWLVTLYFEIVGIYFICELIAAYHKSQDPIIKNRFRYVFWGVIFGFVVGSSAALLVYDIPVDPFWSMFFGLYTLPFAYAILKYDLMDIKIVAKRALLYALSIGLVSVFISSLSFGNQWITERIPGFPFWGIPLLSSIVAVFIAVFVWKKIRESDILKYEFITIITHKFRTPLTRIKWSTENLLGRASSQEDKQELEDISYSTESLVSLTNTLVSLSNSEFSLEKYNFAPISLDSFVQEIMNKSANRAKYKKVTLEFKESEENISVKADKEKLGFVLQTMIENAISYTNPEGKVTISASKKNNKEAVLEVTDTGIGISKENLSFVFTKFFRAENAKETDTEGIGIGLYMSKIILERHSGKMHVLSEGEGKGSTFSFTLPLAK